MNATGVVASDARGSKTRRMAPRAIATLAAITTVIFVSVVVLATNYIQNMLTLDLKQRVELVGQLQASSVAAPLWQLKHDEVKRVVSALKLIFNSSFRTSGEHCPISP